MATVVGKFVTVDFHPHAEVKTLRYRDLFVCLVLRPLRADPFRLFITILGVAVGVAVFLSIQLANLQTMRSFENSVDQALGKADAVIHADGTTFDELVFSKLLPLREWIKAYPVIEGYGVEQKSGEAVEILGTDLLRDSSRRDFFVKTKEENLKGLLPLILDPKGIVLPEKFIPGTHFQPGDRIEFLINGKIKSLNVNAVLEKKGMARALNGNFAIMDIASAQLVFDRVGKLDRIDIEFVGNEDYEKIRARVLHVLPDYLRFDRPERKTQQVGKMLRAFQYNLTALSFVALLVALYLIYNMVALSVVRRRSEIGTLRALGASPYLPAGIFILEATLIGIVGSALGVWLGHYLAQFSLIAVSTTVNNLYAPNYAEAVEFHWDQAIAHFIFGIVASAFSAIIPAWDAASTAPTLVLRRGSYDLKIFRGNQSLNVMAFVIFVLAGLCSLAPPLDGFPYFGFFAVFLIILGISLSTPSALLWTRDHLSGFCKRNLGAEGLLACMNLSQNVGRNALAVSSLAIAFMMVVSMSIMVHSFRQTVIVWLEQTLQADLYVRPAGGRDIDYNVLLPAGSAESVRSIAGVKQVDLFRAMDITYNEKPVALGSGDFNALSRYGNLVIKEGPPVSELAQQLVGQNRAIVSEAFALKHEKRLGDVLKLKTPAGPVEFEITAIYFDYSRERGYIIIDRQTFIKYYKDTEINSFVVYLEDETQLEFVRKEILKLFPDTLLNLRSNAELRRDVIVIFDKTFAITYSLEVIAVFVAALGLFNTLVALVLERKREMGILRMLGAFKNQVKRVILIEAGLLGVTGSVLGFTAGLAVSYLLIFVINKQSFGWTIQVHYPYGFLALLALFFWSVSIGAGLLPARLASRLDPKEAVRTE